MPTSGQLLRLCGALAVCAPIPIFVMAVLTVRIRDSIHGAFGAPRSWRRVVSFAGLSLVLLPILGTMFSLLGLPDVGELVKE